MGSLLTMASLLLLVATALLACQPIKGQDRLAAITKLKEAVVEAYPDKELLMLEVINRFFTSREGKDPPICGGHTGEFCWSIENRGCVEHNCCDNPMYCFCKCKGNKTCAIIGEEELEMIRDFLAKDKAHLDENSLGLLDEIHEYFWLVKEDKLIL